MTRPSVWTRALPWAFATAVLSGCAGSESASAGGDTNTNWLKQCDADLECGSEYSCLCGRCTITCRRDRDCTGQPEEAVCQSPAESCEAETRLCQLPATDTSGDAGQPSSDAGGSVQPGPSTDCGDNPSSCTPSVEPPEIASFEASENSLPGGGGSCELNWDVNGADTLTIQSDQGSAIEVASDEPLTVSVDRTTTYTLIASNDRGSVERSLMVEVSAQGIVDWVAQRNTEVSQANAVATDTAGSLYIAGLQQGLEAVPDGFVAKYAADSGELSWSEELGTDGRDFANDIALDGQGNLVVVGMTEGALLGATEGNGDQGDAFLVKYSSVGEARWTQLVGMSERDVASGVAVDASGFVAVAGQLGGETNGPRAFVARYTANGEPFWIQELGLGEDGGSYANDVAVDPAEGLLTIVGNTYESLDGEHRGLADAFVAQYSSEGELLWIRQFGTNEGDSAEAVGADSVGNLFVAGQSYGGLDRSSLGGADAFLAKYSSEGEVTWREHLASPGEDLGLDVALDDLGNVFIAGVTEGALEGASLGGRDAFVAKYSNDGELLWTRQFGSDQHDLGYGVATDLQGNVFVAGSTSGDFGGPSDGENRSFVVRFR